MRLTVRATRARSLAVPLTLVLAAALPNPAGAQLRIIPQVGLYAPTSELPDLGGATEFGKRESTLAYGLALELGTPDKLSFRIQGLHGTEQDVPVSQIGGCTNCDARSTVTTATATFALRPLPNLIVVQPYLLLGGGIKRYDFTGDDLENEGVRAVLSDQNQLTGHAGLGVELSLVILRAVVELSDLVSKFEPEDGSGGDSELQHDLFFTVGLVLGGG